MATLSTRLVRRLFEITKEFDATTPMKALLVKPTASFSAAETQFYDKLFDGRSLLLPLSYPEGDTNIKPQVRAISFTDTLREVLRSPPAIKNTKQDDIESSLLNILKNLVAVLSSYEANPSSGGYLYNEEIAEHSSPVIQRYIEQARSRLERKENLVQLGEIESGVTLIAHPLHTNEYRRNTVLQVYNYKNKSTVSGVTLNYYKLSANTLIREGGSSHNSFNLYMHDSCLDKVKEEGEKEQQEIPFSVNGITYTLQTTPEIKSEVFQGISFFGDAFEQEIKEGKWIPATMEKELILNAFHFSNLTAYECGMLKRMYWEEILRHLGGDFDAMANLSSNYHKATYMNKIG